ncbi:hypothetical protein I7K31_10280, partial [Neisseria meningitidis]|nr:hypothetical protein [Neisseria meningitidis]
MFSILPLSLDNVTSPLGSGVAAMGAIPRWVLLSAALPELDEVWLKRFCGSFFGLAKKFGVT